MTGQTTDFSKILNDLREWGVNDYRMSELTEIERSKLSKLRTGDRKQPNYDDGVEIMRIYKLEKRKKDKES
jgi:hypothetical protein